jgi:hypothetical protein
MQVAEPPAVARLFSYKRGDLLVTPRNVERLCFLNASATASASALPVSPDLVSPDLVSPDLVSPDVAFVANGHLCIVRREHLVFDTLMPAPVTSMVWADSALIVGTQQGLYTALLPNNILQHLELPALFPFPAITALRIDRQGTLWIGTEGVGMYSRKAGETAFRPLAVAQTITSLAATREGSVWVGTHSGLVRIKDSKITRFAEEIPTEGIALQDNIIERLQTDDAGNLWVFMAEAVSVFSARQLSGIGVENVIDPHTFNYLGKEGNSVSRVLLKPRQAGDTAVKTSKMYSYFGMPSTTEWIVLSSEGLSLLSSVNLEREHKHGFGDVITQPEGVLRRISFLPMANDSLTRLSLPRDCAFDRDNTLWIASADGLWNVPQSVLRRLGK